MAPYSRAVFALAPILGLAFTGCALFLSKESRYLFSAKNRATATDVRSHLGEPASVMSADTGRARWVYTTRTYIQEGTNNAWTTFGAWRCDTYTLTFDDTQILRDWTHTSRRC